MSGGHKARPDPMTVAPIRPTFLTGLPQLGPVSSCIFAVKPHVSLWTKLPAKLTERLRMTDTDLGPYQALLFDMDGTILTSIAAVERAWTAWAERANVPVNQALDQMHGRRAIDTMRAFLPADADFAAEAGWLEARETEDVGGIAEIPGAGALLRSLPPDRWAVVTSATRALALRRIVAAGLPEPRLLISAEDVAAGKPDPAGYLKAARALGVSITRVLVCEDAEAGLQAGRASGAEVLRITGPTPTTDTGLRATLSSYSGVSVQIREGLIQLHLPKPA